MENSRYLKIEANVRYWDDAIINDEQLESGENVPFKNGEVWTPTIDLKNGKVIDWPVGTEAKFHFKVCDAGTYYLLNEEKEVLASRHNNYVPSGLCHGDHGYGDYIIFNVDGNGNIEGYENHINADDWAAE